MKKIFIITLLIIVAIYIGLSQDKEIKKISNESIEERGIFISYIDYSHLFKNKNKEEIEKNIEKIIKNLKDNNFNMIVLQVRPFADAIYNSDVFLSSRMVVKQEGDELPLDILDSFIKHAHKNDIKIHAWVNPYRIRSNSNILDISKSNIWYDWLEKENTNIEVSDQGIYFNPASDEVLNLILKGIEELVKNYDIDGILYDDYFYPTKTIDLKEYEKNIKNNEEISISEFRINNINNLIKRTYEVIKKNNNSILFGISPAGNINNNLNNEYLDIKHILSQRNYIDYVMPQIYFGFENETLPFISTLELWSSLITNEEISLYVALALYKSGLEDKYAGDGIREWKENNDIIKKQIIISRQNNKYKGFCIFRYDHYFYEEENNLQLIKEIDNLKTVF